MAAAELEEITEGTTTFLAPRSSHRRGPKAIEGVPFYNPEMRLARDLSVAVLATWARSRPRPVRVCDAMSSLGARGLRFAHEIPGVTVTLNDANADAVALARENAKRLGLGNLEVRHGRLQALLASQRFDWVDIDPFGTPAPFFESALEGVASDGVLAVTATDKAALCGVYPEVCLERYGARPLHGPVMWEVATRILIGAIARIAHAAGRSIRPLLAHSTHHYVRAYLQMGPAAAAPPLGYAWVRDDLSRELAPHQPSDANWGGPLWSEPLCDPGFVERVATEALAASAATRRRLDFLAAEARSPALYYTIDEFTRSLKTDAPRLATLVERLRARGHAASRTHFTPRGFKTDATVAQIVDALRAT